MRRQEFKALSLPNGLDIYYLRDKTVSFVSLKILLAVGSEDNLPDRNGYAHAVEHQFFHIPSLDGKSLLDHCKKLGYKINASTGPSWVEIELKVPTTAFVEIWPLVLEMMTCPQLGTGLKKEKQVIIQERIGNSTISFYGAIFGRAAEEYGNPSLACLSPDCRLGTNQDILGMTSQKLSTFWRKHFANSVRYLIVTGNCDLEMIAHDLSQLPAFVAPNRSAELPIPPDQTVHRLSLKESTGVVRPEPGVLMSPLMIWPCRTCQDLDLISDLIEDLLRRQLFELIRNQTGGMYDLKFESFFKQEVKIMLGMSVLPLKTGSQLIQQVVDQVFCQKLSQEWFAVSKQAQLIDLEVLDQTLGNRLVETKQMLADHGQILTLKQQVDFYQNLTYQQADEVWSVMRDRLLMFDIQP